MMSKSTKNKLAQSDPIGGKPDRILGLKIGNWKPSRLTQLITGLIILLVGFYGILWGVSLHTRPFSYELANLDFYKPVFSDQLMASNGDVQSPYDTAIKLLFSARADFIGLFPQYDVKKVSEAVELLRKEFEKIDDPLKRAEIAFLLGKAHLMTHQIEDAKTWLQLVIVLDVPDYRQDAQHLLELLPADN